MNEKREHLWQHVFGRCQRQCSRCLLWETPISRATACGGELRIDEEQR